MSKYRDDLEAAHHRIHALEQEVAELRSDSGEVPPPAATPELPRVGGGWTLAVVGGICTVALLALALVSRRPVLLAAVPVCVVFFGVLLVMARQVRVARPCEMLVLTGRMRRLADGRQVGFRTVAGGRVLTLPILERAHRMDLRVRCIDWSIKHAFLRGGSSVAASGYLLVAVDHADPENAVERFLDRDAGELERVARETLEGVLRTVLSTVTLAQTRDQPHQLSELTTSEAEPDFHKLGLVLLDQRVLELRESASDGATGGSR